MPVYECLQVDAFTTKPLQGNPCAVFFDCDDLDAATMLAVAKEMNLSESAFVAASTVADVKVRYFTPSEEIPLAGHPTIATTYALIHTGRLTVPVGRSKLSLELLEGPISVEVERTKDRLERIIMVQRRPVFGATYDPEEVMPAFGLRLDDALSGVPIQTVSTGTRQLMVPVATRAALERAQLDIPAYNALKQQGDFFSPHLFCLEGKTPEGDTYARHFGTPPDVLEDPFTGSATGGMGAFLWRYNLIEHPRFIAEQGHDMGRPGKGWVEVIGSRNAIETVRVGGAAVAVLAGRLTLP